MELNQKENELHVYSINENEYIGAVNLSYEGGYINDFFVILDYSSVAEDAAVRIVNEILPLVMSKVKCDFLHLITFGNGSMLNSLSASGLSKFVLKTGRAANIGIVKGANIGTAIEELRYRLEKIGSSWELINILTISAREINDRENAEQKTKKLIDFLATKNYWRINSQAVRLSTTSNNHQPDTKALSYLLQINNSTEANICDVNITSSNEVIANQIAALISVDMTNYTVFDVENVIISPLSWKPRKGCVVWSGWHIFWLSQVPTTASLKLSPNKPVNVVMKGQLTLETFQQLMKKKLPQIVSHLKILKIVGTAEANEAVDQMFLYFAKTEEDLAVKCSIPNSKVVTNALAGIAMYRSEFRDSAEMIGFYRNPNKAIEDQKEMDRLKEVERVKAEEDERQKREDEDRQKREDEDRQKREEEDRQKREEEDRQKREEEDRQKREEASAAHNVGPNDKPNAVQTIFILDEHLSETNETEQFLEKIIPHRLSKMFGESSQVLHSVTFVRHKPTAPEMLQSLYETLDVTKRIRISILTNREEHEMKSLVETVNNFLLESGSCLFEVEAVKITQPAPTMQRCRVIEQTFSMSFR